MKCLVCEEILDQSEEYAFCPACGYPVFRTLEDDSESKQLVREAAARCREAWIGGAQISLVVHKYKRTPEGLTAISEEKLPAGSCRDLEDGRIHWLQETFGSIRTGKYIYINLKIRNGDKKSMVSVPMLPPAANGTWYVGLSQETPGFLRLYVDNGERCVRSGRIPIHEAGRRPGDHTEERTIHYIK